ncbi:MAG: hypothetical protein ACRDLF_00760 [Solirubrobacteraceae bacterium]
MVAVIWLLLVVVAVVIVALVTVWLDSGMSPKSAAHYQARVELHGIQRRQELTEVKREIRRAAAQTERELQAELERLNRPRRQA